MAGGRAEAGVRYTAADLEYVEREFVRLDALCRQRGADVEEIRAQVTSGELPRPTYVLPDGAEMVPGDYFALADDAGGVAKLRAEFDRRLRLAAATDGIAVDAEEEWDGYVSGLYGACLRVVGPETIVRKTQLMMTIERLLEAPAEQSEAWSGELRVAVDTLDRLERPFAPSYDRLRFGAPSSRDRLITAVKTRYPRVFAGTYAAGL